jgi:hypothetical protein
VWVFKNYIIVKCGCELKYIAIQRNESGEITEYNAKPVNFNIDFGKEVWIQHIYSTGIEDLVQIFVIDDAAKRHYVITWNL